MTAPLTYLKALFLFSASILLIACHSSSSNKAPIPDINTFHIFTEGQSFYSFNEETGLSTKRGEFDAGDNKFLELNLDDNKQGYEYAVYVFENTIYLFNYDKAVNGETIKLAELSEDETICGLVARKTASNTSYTDKIISNRSAIDLPIISIEYLNPDLSNTCNISENRRDDLNFASVIEYSWQTSKIIKSSGKSEDVDGALVIDFSATGSSAIINTNNKKGSTGFLGLDFYSEKLVFKYSIVTKKIDSFETLNDDWNKEFNATPDIKVIRQVSSNHTLVQNDKDIFILDTPNLFQINKADSYIPIQNQIDALFSEPTKTFQTNTPIYSNNRQNTNTFVIKHENSLYYFESEKFIRIPSNETQSSQNAAKLKFDLTEDNTVVVIQEANDIQTLLAISTKSGQSTTILSASKIELYILENELYVNTLEFEAGSGWQAHWFKKLNGQYTPKTYQNSRFIFANNHNEKRNSIYLLSSNDAISSSSMIKPSLYKFDSSQLNGRKKGKDENNSIVDFSFGQLNTNVSDIIYSEVVNDIYGRIVLTGTNEDTGVGRAVEEQYYFDPSETQVAPSINEQSLLFMSRKTL